ncbi:hypothetical protein CLOACE_13470 [Clostridium acetireducens DSM 10703]|uniref:Uncharacterized protein n=1 Tax=Clostridium acetireducens DSM 10703 TaxID=1121290 RepID=A0A1E8EYN8_9CLOT|nr:hypothetical protein [Clostridium acetireducens]OFI05966.1 hypothetical protein CLOACE_13470 [Clostridium acetireducens DSM 10703]
MSKINAFRIINLNYNNNSMKIDDEIFELDGKSTLLSLRNGGGKTVMVQMMMAPFVNKRYRDLKDRAFKSYFTTSSPTYILTEWVLDGGVGHILVGMMIKKRSVVSDEDSSEELDIINFIYEYGMNNKYNIKNFPIVEQNKNTKKIKSFTNAKLLFEELKKDKYTTFNYFDMTASSQINNYFKNLKQYKINHKEWESIIKKINMKESGLSDLFKDAKNVSGLVEKWFIKTVEDKINREDDKVKNFSEIVKKYIYQYRDNQSKIEKKNSIEKFQICAKDILDSANIFVEQKNYSNSLANKIANFTMFLENKIKLEKENFENLNNIILDIENSIKEIQYEEISVEIYNIKDESMKIHRKKEDLERKVECFKNNINSLETQQYILQCAKIYEEYVKASRDVQKYENAIQIIKEKNKNLEPERENIGFTLKKYYEMKKEKVLRVLRENEENIKCVKENIENAKREIEEINKNLQEKYKIEGQLQNSINSFSKEEEIFNERYKKNFKRNIMGYYDENFINKTLLEYKNILNNKEKYISNNKKLLEEKFEENKIEEREKEDLTKEIVNISNEINNIKKQNEIFLKEIEKRKNIIKYVDVDDNKIFNKEYIIEEIAQLNFLNYI